MSAFPTVLKIMTPFPYLTSSTQLFLIIHPAFLSIFSRRDPQGLLALLLILCPLMTPITQASGERKFLVGEPTHVDFTIAQGLKVNFIHLGCLWVAETEH